MSCAIFSVPVNQNPQIQTPWILNSQTPKVPKITKIPENPKSPLQNRFDTPSSPFSHPFFVQFQSPSKPLSNVEALLNPSSRPFEALVRPPKPQTLSPPLRSPLKPPLATKGPSWSRPPRTARCRSHGCGSPLLGPAGVWGLEFRV